MMPDVSGAFSPDIFQEAVRGRAVFRLKADTIQKASRPALNQEPKREASR